MGKNEDVLGVSEMFLGEGPRPAATTEESALGRYRSAMENGEYLSVSFARVDAEGNLSMVDGDVTVCMAADQINGRPYDLRFKAQKLEGSYVVKVVRVEPESKKAWVSHQQARMEKRPGIMRELDRRLNLKRKPPIKVKGRVVRIQSKREAGEEKDVGVWLDLCGVGILGYVHISNWRPTYTSELRSEVRYGDVLEVLVQEKRGYSSSGIMSANTQQIAITYKG